MGARLRAVASPWCWSALGAAANARMSFFVSDRADVGGCPAPKSTRASMCISERASRLPRFFFVGLRTFLGFILRRTQRFQEEPLLLLITVESRLLLNVFSNSGEMF